MDTVVYTIDPTDLIWMQTSFFFFFFILSNFQIVNISFYNYFNKI